MIKWDLTVNLSAVIMFLGGLYTFVKVFLSARDAWNKLLTAVGSKNPPMGLIGDVEHIKIEQQHHRDWLVGAGLDRRHYERRDTN